MKAFAVIMAGGGGTRFWPLSREARPKQLLALVGEEPLVVQTIRRITPLIPPERTLVVTGQAHAQAVRELVEPMGVRVVAEPMRRNTAAAVGVGAVWTMARAPEGICVVLPADHVITNEQVFLATLKQAVEVAQKEDVLVTMGITPTYPATGYGYIELGRQVGEGVYEVAAFREKPPLELAKAYLEGGRHLWNSGMFVWKARVILEEIARYMPELAQGLKALEPAAAEPAELEAAMARVYPSLPSQSIDFGVMEHSSRIRVVKAEFGWSDVGTWDSAAALWPKDEAGNALAHGAEVVAVGARDNAVYAPGKAVGLVGVEGVVVVVTEDGVLVAARERVQDVRKVVEELKARGLKQYL